MGSCRAQTSTRAFGSQSPVQARGRACAWVGAPAGSCYPFLIGTGHISTFISFSWPAGLTCVLLPLSEATETSLKATAPATTPSLHRPGPVALPSPLPRAPGPGHKCHTWAQGSTGNRTPTPGWAGGCGGLSCWCSRWGPGPGHIQMTAWPPLHSRSFAPTCPSSLVSCPFPSQPPRPAGIAEEWGQLAGRQPGLCNRQSSEICPVTAHLMPVTPWHRVRDARQEMALWPAHDGGSGHLSPS